MKICTETEFFRLFCFTFSFMHAPSACWLSAICVALLCFVYFFFLVHALTTQCGRKIKKNISRYEKNVIHRNSHTALLLPRQNGSGKQEQNWLQQFYMRKAQRRSEVYFCLSCLVCIDRCNNAIFTLQLFFIITVIWIWTVCQIVPLC